MIFFATVVGLYAFGSPWFVGGAWLGGTLLLAMRLRQGDEYRARVVDAAKGRGEPVVVYPGVGSKLNGVFQLILFLLLPGALFHALA